MGMNGKNIIHTEIKFMAGMSIGRAVEELLKHKEQGDLVYGVFNGHYLYSDSVTTDTAYMLILGESQEQHQKELQKSADKAEIRRQEHVKAIPEKARHWISEGEKVLESDKLEYWTRIVPIRLGDLYQGMELKQTLDLIKLLHEDRYEEADSLIYTQGHSGMSYALIKQMLIELDSKGQYFVDNYLD